jgi:hypothetical protein
LWDTRGFAAEFERLLELAYGQVTSAPDYIGTAVGARPPIAVSGF